MLMSVTLTAPEWSEFPFGSWSKSVNVGRATSIHIRSNRISAVSQTDALNAHAAPFPFFFEASFK